MVFVKYKIYSDYVCFEDVLKWFEIFKSVSKAKATKRSIRTSILFRSLFVLFFTTWTLLALPIALEKGSVKQWLTGALNTFTKRTVQRILAKPLSSSVARQKAAHFHSQVIEDFDLLRQVRLGRFKALFLHLPHFAHLTVFEELGSQEYFLNESTVVQSAESRELLLLH